MLNHLWCIARKVAAHNLQYTLWMLECWICQNVSLLVALVVPATLISIGPCLRIIAREDAIQVFCIPIIFPNKHSCIGIVLHILLKISFLLQKIVNDCTQEDDITSCAYWNIEVCQSRCTREMRIYMDDFCSPIFRFEHVGKRDWMGFSHITAHDPDTVAIHKVLWKCCSAAAP